MRTHPQAHGTFLLSHFRLRFWGFFFFSPRSYLKLKISFQSQPRAPGGFVQSTPSAPQILPLRMSVLRVITGRRENWLIPNSVLYGCSVPPERSACGHTDTGLEHWLSPASCSTGGTVWRWVSACGRASGHCHHRWRYSRWDSRFPDGPPGWSGKSHTIQAELLPDPRQCQGAGSPASGRSRSGTAACTSSGPRSPTVWGWYLNWHLSHWPAAGEPHSQWVFSADRPLLRPGTQWSGLASRGCACTICWVLLQKGVWVSKEGLVRYQQRIKFPYSSRFKEFAISDHNKTGWHLIWVVFAII